MRIVIKVIWCKFMEAVGIQVNPVQSLTRDNTTTWVFVYFMGSLLAIDWNCLPWIVSCFNNHRNFWKVVTELFELDWGRYRPLGAYWKCNRKSKYSYCISKWKFDMILIAIWGTVVIWNLKYEIKTGKK